MPPLVLSAEGVAVAVDAGLGGRLTSWVVDGMDLLGVRGVAPEESGCYPMAPWPGRLRDNQVRWDGVRHDMPVTFAGWAMHGTVLAKEWQVVEFSQTHVVMATDLGSSWPWSGHADLTWRLGAGSLHSTLAVISDGEAFPAEMGWHPWFRRRLDRGGELRWATNATAMLERGSDHLPSGRRLDPAMVSAPFDDVFHVPDGRVDIHWPGALRMSCQSDAEWVVVYDEPADFVCIEPQTAPPGGPGPLSVVQTGQARGASVTWSWVTDLPR